ASEVLALGLGDIRLNSALNEPLRAEITLLSPTPEDLESLKVTLASASTFDRYGIDRPVFLSRLAFNIVRTGGGNAVVRVTSPQPIAEPFVTFLVEANWAQGRLLREYTVLLDPPTFAPPPSSPSSEAVAAPERATQADRGRIERQAAPEQQSEPSRAAPGTFDTAAGGDYQVQRGDTLWRIAEQVRPDNRLSMNQMMVAIYQSNPDAFAGNVNVLRAGARLTIPSADDIFRISRGDALSEVQRQNAAWSGGAASPAASQPSLTLVPPDGDQQDYRGGTSAADGTGGDAAARERIQQLERQVEQQESLLEVRDNELAQLRDELARLREAREGQAADPLPADEMDEQPADAAVADTESGAAADEEAIFVEDEPAAEGDDAAAEASDEDEAAADEPRQPAPRVVLPAAEPSLVDRIIGALTGIWGLIGLALLIVVVVLVWFARRASGSDDGDPTGVWDALDVEDADSESVASTERLRALARDDDESIVVVEQGAEASGRSGDTVETPGFTGSQDALRETGAPVSLEDTFSSETAINLDQSDPIAEADFHMAYGLYDQAADLINGALAVEPERKDLMAKLCEIYFVWGNRDAFVEAAGRLKTSLGDETSGDWDKIVIMGQQIAGDDEMFSHAKAGSAGQSVDLAFDESGDSGVLDMDFDSGGPDGSVSDIVDVGSDDDDGGKDMSGVFGGANDDDGLDFSFDEEESTGETITREMPRADERDDDDTVESRALSADDDDDPDTTMESPTIQQRSSYDADNTSELPALSDDDETTTFGARGDRSDQTAEIDLDDLGLDLDSLGGDVADGDTGIMSALDDTGTRRAWDDDTDDETGRNERLDDDADSDTQRNQAIDDDLKNATGETQVLSEDFAVETGRNPRVDIADDEATLLAKGLDSGDEPDFDYAATEALPKDTFERDDSLDETGEMPAPTGGTDVDLDLDDLTAALKMSESGDTVNQPRDDETVEQPHMKSGGDHDLDFDLGLDSDSEEPTQSLSPDDLSDDLHDARTMTEVGTKLDLARAYVDMGDPGGARNILEEVLEEGDASQRQQAQQLLDTLPG
ncbi:MAG: FimV/HubP family polar landmark protein, partial [Woeseia sp.]